MLSYTICWERCSGHKYIIHCFVPGKPLFIFPRAITSICEDTKSNHEVLLKNQMCVNHFFLEHNLVSKEEKLPPEENPTSWRVIAFSSVNKKQILKKKICANMCAQFHEMKA